MAIKKFEPGSVSELAEKVGRDFKSVYEDLNELEAAGLIEFEGAEEEKKMKLRCNELVITIYDYGNPDEERRPWDDKTIVPKIINGKADDKRCNKSWDWFYPPYK